AAILYAQPERCDLRFARRELHVNAGRRRLAVGANPHRGKPFYYRGLDRPNHGADSKAAPPEVDHQVSDELPGSVIGDLPTAVDREHWNAVVAQQVLAPAREAERVDRRMLREPDLVAGRFAAGGGERLHRAPGRCAVGAAEGPNRDIRADGRHRI